MSTVAARTTTLGTELVHALVANDLDTARTLLAPHIAFRALLPQRVVELGDRDEVMELLAGWFPSGAIDELQALDTATIVDRQYVGYRVLWHNPAGEQLIFEQQVTTMSTTPASAGCT